jgi:hypothetical protein
MPIIIIAMVLYFFYELIKLALKHVTIALKIFKTNKPKNALSWQAFSFFNTSTHPPKYGKYLVYRKDGKTHWETWNGSGWAYNHNEIRYWAIIISPINSN